VGGYWYDVKCPSMVMVLYYNLINRHQAMFRRKDDVLSNLLRKAAKMAHAGRRISPGSHANGHLAAGRQAGKKRNHELGARRPSASASMACVVRRRITASLSCVTATMGNGVDGGVLFSLLRIIRNVTRTERKHHCECTRRNRLGMRAHQLG